MGPLHRASQVEEFEKGVKRAVAEGGIVVAGGKVTNSSVFSMKRETNQKFPPVLKN